VSFEKYWPTEPILALCPIVGTPFCYLIKVQFKNNRGLSVKITNFIVS
jgi:hypothetical protein